MRQDPVLQARARTLRRAPTPAEQRLWQALRHDRLGVRFTRQHVVGSYIADFAARPVRLIIELDGDTHAGQVAYDAARTDFLERQGYRVLRFANADVMNNPDGVIAVIAAAVASGTTPHPTLPPVGGGLSAPSPHRGEGWGGGRPEAQPARNNP